MFCTKCGKKLNGVEKFCTGCGSPVNVQPKVENVETTQNNSDVMSQVQPEAVTKVAEETQLAQVADTVQPEVAAKEAEEAQVVDAVQPEVATKEAEEAQVVDVVQPEVAVKEAEEVQLADVVKPEDKIQVVTPAFVVENTQKQSSLAPVDQIINETSMEQEISAAKPKRSRAKVWVIVSIIVILLLAGGGTYYFMQQNHIEKQADVVMSYLDEDDYEEAFELYEKYSGEKDSFDEKVLEGLQVRVERVKEQYQSEEIDYNRAIRQLNDYKDFDIKQIDKLVNEVETFVNDINTSRRHYEEGKNYYEMGEFQEAIEAYSHVIIEDSKNYLSAKTQIAEAEKAEESRREEEESRREEEYRNTIIEQALDNAEYYAWDYDYESAIHELEEGLIISPGNQELLDRLTSYQELNEMTQRVANISPANYSYSYQEQDQDIMTVSMVFPTIEGDSPAYKAINEQIDFLRVQYAESNDIIAEDARAYSFEEYFHTYSFDVGYSVQYNDKGILSILFDGYVYTGGAHGNPFKTVYTFSLKDGRLLYLDDLMSVEESVFAPLVLQEFERMYNENPDEYWEDAYSTVEEDTYYYSSMQYIITEENITIFYHPYELGSYARGFVDIVIPYAGNELLFDFLQ